MTNRLSISAVACVLSLAPCCAWAQTHSQTRPASVRPPHENKHTEREQIETLEKQFRAAQQAGDTSTMDKLLSDDYLGINASGVVVTKQQQLDHMTTRKLVIDTLQTSDLKIKLIGNIAIVTCLAEINGTNDGVPLHGKFRYTRIYQKLDDGTWKITSFEATRLAKQAEPDAPATTATATMPPK
jgi:ketosteroid isomerase-like protein